MISGSFLVMRESEVFVALDLIRCNLKATYLLSVSLYTQVFMHYATIMPICFKSSKYLNEETILFHYLTLSLRKLKIC